MRGVVSVVASPPPERRGIELRAAWPPVSIETRFESRSEHGRMAVLMLVVTAGIFVSQGSASPIPLGWAVLPAFICGYAISNYSTFGELYEEPDGGDDGGPE